MHDVAVGKYEDFEKVIDMIGGINKFVKRNDRVFIKPNICATKSHETGTVTNPYLIKKLIVLLKEVTPNIKIGDGPIPAFKKLSPKNHPVIYNIAEKYGIEVLDLNYADKIKLDSFVLSSPPLEADVMINMPVLKTHVRTGVSISLKNMMGVVPFRLKHEMHKQGLERRIADLAKTIKPHLNIVDATICQEGEGPTNGAPVKLGLVIAGDNRVAVDAVGCRIMGVNPRSIPHIKLAEKGEVGSTRNVKVIGFKPEFVRKFKLPFLYANALTRFGLQIAESSVIKLSELNNKILIDRKKCTRCKLCVESCPVNALNMSDIGPVVDEKQCILCLCCHEACLNNAIRIKKTGIFGSGKIQI